MPVFFISVFFMRTFFMRPRFFAMVRLRPSATSAVRYPMANTRQTLQQKSFGKYFAKMAVFPY